MKYNCHLADSQDKLVGAEMLVLIRSAHTG
jgi:hypothetical protein